MANKKYFVNNGAANLGPWEMSTIINKVNALEIKATDQVCVSVDNDEWMMICQHQEFIEHFEKNKPEIKPSMSQGSPQLNITQAAGPGIPMVVAPPASVEVQAHQVSQLANEPVVSKVAVAHMALPVTDSQPQTDLTVAQWFILKGKNRFGPFMYVDVIRMLQEKSVFEFDYVWAQGVDKWKRIAEISVFSPENIRALFGGGAEEKGLFYRRNYPRAKYEIGLICHDNSKIWKGKTCEISEGGAGVVIENALILPGQNVYMHFKPGPFSKSFNVLCEVVSKQFMTGLRDTEAPVLYGIKFININKQDRESIRLIHTAA